MPSVSFKLKILTPMFMGGANPDGQPELRAASIRGAMRFWFRAIAGAITSDPREVYRLESGVFGNTEQKSKVVVRVVKVSSGFNSYNPLPHKTFFSNKAIKRWDQLISDLRKGNLNGNKIGLDLGVWGGHNLHIENIVEILNSYLMEVSGDKNVEMPKRRKEIERLLRRYKLSERIFTLPAFPINSRLEVHLNILDEKFRELVFYSFWLSTALGGWGRRSRRGAGTVIIDKRRSDIPEDFKEFLSKGLKEQLDIVKGAFNKHLKQSFESKKRDWPYLVEVREWKKKFPDVWEGDSPIVYMFTNLSQFLKKGNDKCLIILDKKRYASPLVLRVIPKDGQYSLRITVLKAEKRCEAIVDGFFKQLKDTKEVWHA